MESWDWGSHFSRNRGGIRSIGQYYPRFVRHVILGRVGIRKKISIKMVGKA